MLRITGEPARRPASANLQERQGTFVGVRHLLHRVAAVVAMALTLSLWQAPPAGATGISLIRDAEIEATLTQITTPILEAAGLDPSAVQIYIVQDDKLNAFVAGGMNLFLNTGLLMRTEHVGQLLGVIAHEVGHIAGGHLSRVGTAQKRAAAEMILATVLGAAAAVAGAPDLGTAIITGGQSYAFGGLMRFSRSQEQAADQAALTYLHRAGLSARGLAEFFRVLESQNMLAVSGSPYLQSHPLTRDRITFVENQAQSDGADRMPPAWQEGHARMVAKLHGFLDDARQAVERYQDDASFPGRYALAIAHYRMPDLEQALREVDALIADEPDNPYLHELKGQMLFENGRVDAAIAPYRKAVELRSDSALLSLGLARALIETGQDQANREAIGHLKVAVERESTNAGAWRLLGIAQGRAGLEGASSLSLAEYALLTGKREDARMYAKRAEASIEPSDPTWIRLQDILRVIDES
jgi:predicted Zn-dependent protease